MNQTLTHTGDQRGPNYTSLALTIGLTVVIIEAGAFLFIIGALILGTMLYLVPAAATLEGKSTFDAMRRSRHLFQGNGSRPSVFLRESRLSLQYSQISLGESLGFHSPEKPLPWPP